MSMAKMTRQAATTKNYSAITENHIIKEYQGGID